MIYQGLPVPFNNLINRRFDIIMPQVKVTVVERDARLKVTDTAQLMHHCDDGAGAGRERLTNARSVERTSATLAAMLVTSKQVRPESCNAISVMLIGSLWKKVAARI